MNFESQPPVTNRGVPHTCESGLIACVDWLQVTFKKISNAHDIITLLGLPLDHFNEQKKGLYGWQKSLCSAENDIRIFFSGNDDTTHLMITGRGCRYFEKYSCTNWSDFLAVIQNTDINIKRLDLAIDDYKGYYNPSTIYRKIKQGAVVSEFRKGRWIESFNLSEYEKQGTTIYIGSPKSSTQLRIYDKLKERESKNFIVDKDIKHWVRTELQLRDERAEAAALMIAFRHKEIGELASGILKKKINFKVKSKTESNKSRWKNCKWWNDFLKGVDEVSLTLNVQEPTLEKTVDWANTQWLKSMYSMYMVFEQDMEMFYKMMVKGQSKMEKKDFKKIEDFKQKYGNLTFEEYLDKKKNDSNKMNRLNR